MITSPKPVSGVVTFTEHGNAALDKLAATLAAEGDGSPTSIANVLEHVLETDIEDLAEALNELIRATSAGHRGYDVPEVGPAAESPDEAARRRLEAHAPAAGGAPETRSSGIAR